jgi:sialidase-1
MRIAILSLAALLLAPPAVLNAAGQVAADNLQWKSFTITFQAEHGEKPESKGGELKLSLRIPAAIVTPAGTVLAFCEGRVKARSDAGDIDLILRRSGDGGKTWGDIQVVWNDGANTCGNPCPVIDRAGGTICLLMTWNRGDDG